MGVVNQPTTLIVNGVSMSGGEIELTIPGGTADPQTGEITFPSPVAASSGIVKTFTVDNTDITNKFLLVDSDITAEPATQLEIETLAPQFYNTDYVVDGVNKKKVKWNGLGLDGLIASGDKVTIIYS